MNTEKKTDNYKIDIPQCEIEAFARIILPEIQKFFQSDEGKREFEEWKKKKRKNNDLNTKGI